jgi:hypothetical protein
LANVLKDLSYLEEMANNVDLSNPIVNSAKNRIALALSAGGDGPEDHVPHLVDLVAKRNRVTRISRTWIKWRRMDAKADPTSAGQPMS